MHELVVELAKRKKMERRCQDVASTLTPADAKLFLQVCAEEQQRPDSPPNTMEEFSALCKEGRQDEAIRILVQVRQKYSALGYEPIHYAARFNCVQVLRHLIEDCKVPIGATTALGRTPLHYAVASFATPAIDYLLGLISVRGESKLLDQPDNSGKTPLDGLIGLDFNKGWALADETLRNTAASILHAFPWTVDSKRRLLNEHPALKEQLIRLHGALPS